MHSQIMKVTMMTSKENVLIIVLSGNYSTGLGLVRSLGSAGYYVDIISAVKRKGSSVIASSSRYVRRSDEVLLTSDEETDRRNILDKLKGYRTEDGLLKVLIPADDRMSNLLDHAKNDLSKDFIIAGTTEEGGKPLGYLMDKAVQGRYAKEIGLKRPEEWILDLEGSQDIPEDIIFPCFIKPLKSIEGNKTEMSRADDLDQLRDRLKKLSAEDSHRSVLVQRFLEIDKEYDIGGICVGDQVIIPGMIEKTRVAQFERGVTLAGRMISCDPLGETLDKITELMKSFKYTGLFDLELILSKGELYLNEINFRAGGPNYSYTLNGTDLPALLVKGMLGGEIRPQDVSFTEGKTFVYEKVAWEEYIQGFMTRKELYAVISGADMKLLDNMDDPVPGKIFSRKIRLSLLKHRILRR